MELNLILNGAQQIQYIQFKLLAEWRIFMDEKNFDFNKGVDKYLIKKKLI